MPSTSLRAHLEKDHPLTKFTDLGLDARLLQALETEGYTNPTPIQAQAIPPVMQGGDLLGIAQTGTGKTAAFALPILHRLAADRKQPQRRGCRVLVLSPTRELASQIADSFRTYGRHLGVTVAVVFGGVGHRPQIQQMARGVDVLVATPGRLLDHMGERNISLAGTEIFVLDEADQMLDLGFLPPIRKVVAQLSAKRQNLFFSATMPGEIGKLASELLHNPVKVSVAPSATTAERVSQRVIHVERHGKRAVLVELLANADLKRTLVFTRTKRGADKVAEHLQAHDIRSAAIHGNKSQGQRERALEQFRRSEIRVLVATDIAARGIDIDQVSHVINFELPEVPEAYVHRIGRTARAGADGIAISLCDPDERAQLRDIERLTRQAIPHENRINGDTVPLDTTGAPRGRPPGARTSATFKPRGDRKPHRGQGPRHDDRRPGSGDSMSARGDFAPRGDRAERRPHGDRKPSGDAVKARGDFAPRADRNERGPHGDRKPTGDGIKARGEFAPRGDRAERRPHGDRKPSGDGVKARGEFASRGDRNDRRPHGDRKPSGDGVKARGEFAPRGDRNGAQGARQPQGERGSLSGKPHEQRGQRDGQNSNRAGKPGGYQGLKRKSTEKGVWTNRP
jgi:ATP-dependent RNA helicase RhlE